MSDTKFLDSGGLSLYDQLMKELIENNLKNKAEWLEVSQSDFDTLTMPGLYTVEQTGTNAPDDNGYYSLIVCTSTVDSQDYVHQIAIPELTNDIYIRCRNGSMWSDWLQLSSEASREFLSSLSLSGSTISVGVDFEVPYLIATELHMDDPSKFVFEPYAGCESLTDVIDLVSESGGTSITVDSVLSSTSTNPVQNKVVNSAINTRAPKSHAASSTTYGVGTSGNYGHVKLSDSVSTTSGTSGGIASTPTAVKTAYDKAVDAKEKIDGFMSTNDFVNVQEIKEAMDEKLDTMFSSNGYAGIDELTIDVLDIKNSNLAPPTTITIGCVDSKHSWLIDYVCTGSNDTTLFQYAINALPSDGGKIVVLDGTYNISSKLTCNKNVIIEGMGDSTIINCTAHEFLYNSTPNYNITIKSIKFNCTGAFNDLDVFIESASYSNILIDNCTINSTISSINTSASNYIIIPYSGKLTITNSRIFIDIQAYTNIECFAFINGDGYLTTNAVSYNNTLISNSDITLYNCHNTTISSSNYTTGDAYILRSGGTISNCNIQCRGNANSSGSYKTIANVVYSANIFNCYIDINDSYASITSYNGSTYTSQHRMIGNYIKYYNVDTYAIGGVVSNNVFISNRTTAIIYFNVWGAIVTSNKFCNNAENTIVSGGYIIFKDNCLRYACTVNSSSSSIVSDNYVSVNI